MSDDYFDDEGICTSCGRLDRLGGFYDRCSGCREEKL